MVENEEEQEGFKLVTSKKKTRKAKNKSITKFNPSLSKPSL